MIGRAATAQDDIVGDGTTSNVLFIGELLRQAERYLGEGVHPRILVDGIDIAKKETLNFLESFKIAKEEPSKELLMEVAKNSLLTKIHPKMANPLTEIVVDSVNTIKKGDKIDLHMIEIMHMIHKMSTDSRLVKGLVLDHGGRHSDLPSTLNNCYIMVLNVSLEYEKTEVHSGFFWSNADQREKLIASERAFTDEKVQKIIDFKKKVCDGTDKNLVIINQKGIDPPSLDMLAAEGIIGMRRAKKRNMERLPLCCGGKAINSVEDMDEADLGWADSVKELVLGDDKYTFIEGVKNPQSCTILINGPNDYSIAQTKEAIRDGLRSVKNTIEDKCVIPGAGAFEIAAAEHLSAYAKEHVQGKVKLGVNLFSEALLIIPRTLAANSGFDIQETILKVQEAHLKNKEAIGVDILTGEPQASAVSNIWDNYCVKRQFLNLAPILTQQLLLVDEVMRAGKAMGRGQE
jgi:T-complex protein 1 subunit zeta